MRVSLFSQSLFALNLDDAIAATAEAGYPAIELACAPPHFGPDMVTRAHEVAAHIRAEGLVVSALSLFNNFTDPLTVDQHVAAAEAFIRLAPVFDTSIVKCTPGQPASGEALEDHWLTLRDAVNRLAPVARESGARLAFETHMRQLTDTLGGSLRFLDLAPPDTVGLTVDFSNLRFAGEDLAEAVPRLAPRMWNAHVKNGFIEEGGGWDFRPLDTGLTDYRAVLVLLRDLGYDGYLAVECLGPDAANQPRETVRRDRELLQALLEEG